MNPKLAQRRRISEHLFQLHLRLVKVGSKQTASCVPTSYTRNVDDVWLYLVCKFANTLWTRYENRSHSSKTLKEYTCCGWKLVTVPYSFTSSRVFHRPICTIFLNTDMLCFLWTVKSKTFVGTAIFLVFNIALIKLYYVGSPPREQLQWMSLVFNIP